MTDLSRTATVTVTVNKRRASLPYSVSTAAGRHPLTEVARFASDTPANKWAMERRDIILTLPDVDEVTLTLI